MDKERLLIVDDDEDIRSQLKWALVEQYDIATAEDRPTALASARSHRPEVVLLDLGLPPEPGSTVEGMATLKELIGEHEGLRVIVVTGQNEDRNAREAVGLGAHDFLSKPIEITQLTAIVQRAFFTARMNREFLADQRPVADLGPFEGMIGGSPVMQKVFHSIARVAASEAPVLILGESGTGKERVAQAIHRRSSRVDGPFIAINCGAIPETLIESELFGHEKGAFTGAHEQRQGRVEAANGGTLFLDEVGELPAPSQVKLLRFLQEGYIERVGGRERIPVNARVLSATNANLEAGKRDGSFRDDLYFRLAVVVIELPPLRERGNDLDLLTSAFLQRYGTESGRAGLRLAPAALRAIERHTWPGNIRELENCLRRAVIMCEGKQIKSADLGIAGSSKSIPGHSLTAAREALDRELVEKALSNSRGKISKAADELGISRPTLYELIDKLGIERR